MNKYIARVIENISNGKGYWDYTKVGIFEQSKDSNDNKIQTQIGEYIRDYHSPKAPFYAFQHANGDYYALYSSSYMYTRILSLPSCKDLGGEDKTNIEYKDHFCPVEYYVPKHFMKPKDWYPEPKRPDSWGKDWGKEGVPLTEEEKLSHEKWLKDNHAWIDMALKNKCHLNFGFVSGCFWGDDGGWKIEYIDLKDADKGVIRRYPKFGYWELPNISLRKAIHLICVKNDYDDSNETRIDIATNKCISEHDDKMMIMEDGWKEFKGA